MSNSFSLLVSEDHTIAVVFDNMVCITEWFVNVYCHVRNCSISKKIFGLNVSVSSEKLLEVLITKEFVK
jgi:hypothetical protein